MADHIAEQILDTLQQVLQASGDVTVADTSIVRDRVDAASALPDISIDMGADDVVEGSDDNMSSMDSMLNVEIVVSVKNSTGLSNQLNAIRKGIHKAIYADVRMGMAQIIDGRYTGTGKPVTSGDAENEIAAQVLNYQFWYRHTLADPSV